MLTIQSRTQATAVKGQAIYDFLLHPTDQDYQRWWPGTHLAFHPVKSVPHDVGNVVYMDEFIGKKRFKMTGIVGGGRNAKPVVGGYRRNDRHY